MRRTKLTGRARRKVRVRKKVNGTTTRPRLSVFRSSKHIYVQAVDDEQHLSLTGASSRSPEIAKQIEEKRAAGEPLKKAEIAKLVGTLIAERCAAKSIRSVVFDRNGFMFTGRIKELADAARKGGLEF